MIKSYTGAVAALTLGLTLAIGGVASAADSRPVEGTAACTNLVETNPAVTNARGALDLARNELADLQESGTATRAELNTATAEVEQRTALLAQARINTRNLLCQDGPVESPKPTTTAPTVVVPGPTVVQRPTTVVENPTTVERERTTTTVVVPTQDDGSVASVSGSQVSEVPEGSASTGVA